MTFTRPAAQLSFSWPRYAIALALLTACGPASPQQDGGTDAGNTSGDAGADPLVTTWAMSGNVTSSGGSMFTVDFSARLTAPVEGGYRVEAGDCFLVLNRDTAAGAPTLHAAGNSTTSCSPSFLTVHYGAGMVLGLDPARPVRLAVTALTITLSAGVLSMSGTGNAGFADGSLTPIQFTYLSR